MDSGTQRSQAPAMPIRRPSSLLAFALLVLAACTASSAPLGSPGATDLGAMGCQIAAPSGFDVRTGDPLAVGEPIANAPVTRMSPRQVGDTARAVGLAVTWRYDVHVGAQTGFSECWCIPPDDGRVTGVAYGMAGELVVFVDSGRTAEKVREQPARGWGC
jgi:hypothetical protein